MKGHTDGVPYGFRYALQTNKPYVRQGTLRYTLL
jgi:hypothetical protein